MGDDYGPIVVARTDGPSSLKGVTVAVPGTLTTAFLTLRMYDPSVEYVVMPFDRIQDAVRGGEVAAGLLIHEGQLTYQDEGLKKIVDLGEWWAGVRVVCHCLSAATSSAGISARRSLRRCRGSSCQHRIRARASAGGARLRTAVRARTRSCKSGSIRRHVCQRADTRARRTRPHRRAAVVRRGLGKAALSPNKSPPNSARKQKFAHRVCHAIG